ncbi:MAG: ATP-binding protein [Pseudomonadota bacterium]
MISEHGADIVELGSKASSAFGHAERVLNALPNPVMLIKLDNTIVFANTATETFFQSSCNILSRQKITEVVAFDSPLIALIDQVRRTGLSINEQKVDIKTPFMKYNHLTDIFCGVLPEDPSLMMVLLRERSMSQMIERHLTHKVAARSVSGMAAVLAHEIKNPLSGIRGAVQLLESSIAPEERSLTKLIYTEIDRICTLVDKMEVFGDRRAQNFAPVNIHDVLDHVRQLAVNGFARHIEIREHYDPSLPSVPGCRDQLIQVFLNLIKNAAEAIGLERQDGVIILTTAFRPGVRLSVPGLPHKVSLPMEILIEDNGTGICESLKPHLFEPFMTSKKTSAGLGLALVAKIIDDHGGVIECDTSTAHTVFRVLMPILNKAETPHEKVN